MYFTLEGITVFLQPAINAFSEVSIIALQLSRESYTVFPSSTMIDIKLLQPWKTRLPIDVTLEGIVTDVKPLQPKKADLPIDVTLEGIIVFWHPVINVLSEVLTIALQLLRESYTVLPSSITIDVKPLQCQKAS